jgi:thiamine biosynthesis protein ThiI
MLGSVIVRYGEIFLKSEYVRRVFAEALLQNIRGTLKREGLDAKASLRRHRIYLKSGEPVRVSERVAKVFGVSSSSPAEETEASLDEMAASSLAQAKEALTKDASFAVRARRTGNQSYSSKDIEVAVGRRIQEETHARVDLTSPDTIIYIEVHGEKAFVFSRKFPGIGGLPYGTQGKVLGLVPDERGMLASWMMMKRGCVVLPVYERFDEKAKRMHKTLEYFTPSGLKYLEEMLGNPDETTELAVKEKCLGVVSDRPIYNIRGQKLPYYTPLAGLSMEDVSDRLMFLRSCVKY